MTSVAVDLKDRAYEIVVGADILPRLGAAVEGLRLGRDAVVVTDTAVRRLYGRVVARTLREGGGTVKSFAVPPGEESKAAAKVFALVEEIARYDVRRSVFIVALGGGVVGDLAGFVAAVYKRGVAYIQVPTTLLAQIDSAIGGKVGIDLPVGKNLMGAFHQPRLVWSDVTFLRSLDDRQIRNGLAEAVKYGVICDPGLFRFIERRADDLLSRDPGALTEVVLRCSRIKARIVAGDERETRGMRTILNFGHTVGHAVEAAAGFQGYQHGEAVALGMRVALDISRRLGLIERGLQERVEDLLSGIGLPERISGIPLPAILRHMAHDKKFLAGRNRFVLVTDIGRVRVTEGVPSSVIREAVRSYSLSSALPRSPLTSKG